MIQLDEISLNEKEAIEKLKRRTIHKLTPRLLKDETLYYRFLKARDFNVDNAEAMLLKCLSVREYFEIEKILENNTLPKYVQTYFPVSFTCYDKEGSVVRYSDLGGTDVRGVVSTFEFKTIMQFAMEYLERDIDRMTIQTEKLGKQASKIVFILNMENLSAAHITNKKGFGIAYEFTKVYQDCFPERAKAIYIINASFYFNVAFNILKNIMASELLKKIHVFGKTGWQEVLLNVIEADELPAFLGGNKTDPDGNPRCETWISHGKKVPEKLYLKNNKKLLREEDGVEKLSVYRYSVSEVSFNIHEPETFLEWEFVTSKDIFFGLYYKDVSQQDPEVEELIPKQKVESVDSAITGAYKCNKLGAYIIVFDNTHCWLHSKEIYYKVRMTKPEQKSFNLIEN